MQDVLEWLDHMMSPDISKTIYYEPNSYNNILKSDAVSRINYKCCEYLPYELTYSNITYLDARIRFLPVKGNEVIDFSNFNKLVYNFKKSSNSVTLWKPKQFDDIIVRNQVKGNISDLKTWDITILGIIALLTRRYYGNDTFKYFIEENYLKKNYDYSDIYGLWILNKDNRIKQNITKDFIIHLIDINYNLGIEFLDKKIPYTFKWGEE